MKKLKVFAVSAMLIAMTAACGGSDKKSDDATETTEFESVDIDDSGDTDAIDIEGVDLDDAADEVEEVEVVEIEDEDDDATTASTGSSTDWDDVLDSYEKYVDSYIKLYKRAQQGDMSALAEYASLLESAQELSDKLSNASDDLTPAQAARYSKISAKMANAAL